MENKTLYKYLLNDLSELEELFTEKQNGNFDALEMEFLNSRVKGAKKLIEILSERELNKTNEIKEEPKKQNVEVAEIKDKEEHREEEVVAPEPVATTEPELVETEPEEIIPEDKAETEEKIADSELITQEKPIEEEEKVELREEKKTGSNKTLGDSFSKEKSINDLISANNTKLEEKLSNRPVVSIKSAIGINDRFQFIRELFDGKAEGFSNAVEKLDEMKDLKEAVEFLQQNFEWKKNETSLKFVNLVKRRFPNE